MTPFHVALLSFTGGTLLTTGLFIWIESRGKQFQALNQSQTEVISQLSSIQGKIEAGKIDIQKKPNQYRFVECCLFSGILGKERGAPMP